MSSLKAYPFTLFRSVMVILLVTLIVMVTSATCFFDYQSRQNGNQMSQQLLLTQSEMAQHKLEEYLDNPHELSHLLQQYLQGGQSSLNNEMIRPEMVYLTSRAFSAIPAFHSFSWSEANGEHFAILRDKPGSRIYLERTDSRNPNLLISYNGLSEETNIVKSNDNFDVQAQPWFRSAQLQHNPWWTTTPDKQGLIATLHSPVYANKGRFLGVISSSLRVAEMSQFLESIKPGSDYSLMLIGPDQQVIASTDNAPPSAQLADPQSEGAIQTFEVGQKTWLATTFDVQDSEHLLNWRGVLMVPKTAVLAGSKQQHLLISLSIVIVILLLMAALGVVIMRFTGSLKETVKKLRQRGLTPWHKEQGNQFFPELVELNQALSSVSQAYPAAAGSPRNSLEEDTDTHFLTRGGLLHTAELYDNRNLLAMIQVSNFNSVKNALGTTLAKEFIQHFAERLRSLLPEGALCCRDREDTFIIAFAGMYEHKDVTWYRSILSSVFRMNPTEMGGASPLFTGHVGMVIEPVTKENISECLRNVSLAVQHAQNQRNGTCELFTPEMREEEVHNLRLHQALRDDLQNEGFHLVMQPIVPFVEGAPCCEGECLIRWQSNVLGFVPPDKFIALAEHTGMIVPLGKWIIETACRELADFIARGAPEDFKLHVNISAVQLSQPDFSRHLLECIHRYELNNSNICIEITESVLLHDTHRIVEILAYLRRLGISVAIDDFGSGYSSLSYLHSLPFDCLKIDRGFVRNVLDDKKSEAVIASVLMLSQSFEVPLVAEGVETAEMAAKLLAMGCDLAQGYYYSRPKPFADFTPAEGQFVVLPD